MFTMKFNSSVMPEYSLDRQRRDYQDALPVPYKRVQAEPRYSSVAQDQSLLLSKLPSEIRFMIWRYAIGDQKVHIINKYRRIGHAVMDRGYWHQCRANKPSIQAASWMYTYGSLPTTKLLAGFNMCNLLSTCRQIYHEAIVMLYSTNTFAFWDLRTVEVLKHCIPLSSRQAIRYVEVYAAFYRKEDIKGAIEARSLLQLEAWPAASNALATLPNLQSLTIMIAKPLYLDEQHLTGSKAEVLKALLNFVEKVRVDAKMIICLPGVTSRDNMDQYDMMGIGTEETLWLEDQLSEQGITCKFQCFRRKSARVCPTPDFQVLDDA